MWTLLQAKYLTDAYFFFLSVFTCKRNAVIFKFVFFSPVFVSVRIGDNSSVSCRVSTEEMRLKELESCFFISYASILSSEFDPCTESFKGLADLIEKENGRNSWSSQGLNNSLGHDQHSFASHMPRPLQGSVPTASGPSQHSVPPGFSLSHLHSQQREQFQQQFYAGGQSSRQCRVPDLLAILKSRKKQQHCLCSWLLLSMYFFCLWFILCSFSSSYVVW